MPIDISAFASQVNLRVVNTQVSLVLTSARGAAADAGFTCSFPGPAQSGDVPIPVEIPNLFAIDPSGCVAKCKVAPEFDAVYALYANGTHIADVTFLAGQTVGTFSSFSAVTFGGPTYFECFPPASADPSIYGVSITIKPLAGA